MRTVFVFLEPEEFDRLEDVSGEGAVRIGCDAKNGRLFLFLRSGSDEDTLGADLSVNVSRMAARDWIYVGQLAETA